MTQKMWTFAVRNIKEILRDPLNLAFGIGFPIVLLLLLSAIQANIPVSLFELPRLTPGVTVFGLSFLTLFSATILAKDRGSAFLQRLYSSPMSSWDFLLAYTLPIVPMALLQGAVCYLLSFCLGLQFSVNVVWALLGLSFISLFYIFLGILCGSLLTDKQVGGICGALLTNLSAWLSGIWFDLDLVGGVFKTVANVLPFVHAVELEKALFVGEYTQIFPHVLWVLFYVVLFGILAVWAFFHQMKSY